MYGCELCASRHVVGSPVAPASPAAPSPTRLPELEPLAPLLEVPELDAVPSPLPPSLAKPPSLLLEPEQAPTMTKQPSPSESNEVIPRMREACHDPGAVYVPIEAQLQHRFTGRWQGEGASRATLVGRVD